MPPDLSDSPQTFAQLVASGLSPMKAAAQCGLTPAAARAVMKSPLYKALVDKHKGEADIKRTVQEAIDARTPEAIAVLEQIMLSEKAPVAIRASIGKWFAENSTELRALKEKQDTGQLIQVIIEDAEAVNLGLLLHAPPFVPTAEETATIIEARRGIDYG